MKKIKIMKTASRKNKGRLLQQWVVKVILSVCPELTKDDVRSTSMGAGGVDVQLSAAAKKLIPYSIETKNQEVSKTVYDWYAQACDHGSGEPLLVIKRNREKPLVVVDAEHFIKVIANARRASNQQTD